MNGAAISDDHLDDSRLMARNEDRVEARREMNQFLTFVGLGIMVLLMAFACEPSRFMECWK